MKSGALVSLTVILLAATMLSVAGILVYFSLPLLHGTVAPNSSYGLRTPKTLHDAVLWRRANQDIARVTIACAALLAVDAAAYVFAMMRGQPTAIGASVLGLALLIAPLVLLAVVTAIYTARL